MTTLYKYDCAYLDHPPYLLQGEPVVVGDSWMVKLSHGTIVPATGFKDTLAAAKADCAVRLEQMVQPVLERIAAFAREGKVTA